MTPRMRIAATSLLVGALSFGTLSGASALWTVNDTTVIPAMRSGSVSFAVQDALQQAPPVTSRAGEAISLTIPGSVMAEVLTQTGLNPDPFIWRFHVTGAAYGIAGLEYDVVASAQITKDGTVLPLEDGKAASDTLLANSTLRIYPAGEGDDCSLVPELPEGDERNVHLYEAEDHTLQAADTNHRASPLTQTWCAAVDWNQPPDGVYVNGAVAVGIGEDGSSRTAVDEWIAAVAFPVSLEALGIYRNRAEAEGRAEDGTFASDDAIWEATVFPDPSREPAVVLEFQPTVTTVSTAPRAERN